MKGLGRPVAKTRVLIKTQNKFRTTGGVGSLAASKCTLREEFVSGENGRMICSFQPGWKGRYQSRSKICR